MKKLIILAAMIFYGNIFSQALNDYKYIIVPESYDILGKTNQYQLNALTKFLFEKNGFQTIMKTETWPEDLQQNPCLGISPVLVEDSGLFVTKMHIELQDCKGMSVYKTREGKSKEKEFQAAYQESFRDAFQDLVDLQYEYKSNSGIAKSVKKSNEISSVMEEKNITSEVKNEVVPESESNVTSELLASEKNDLPAGSEVDENLTSLENSLWIYGDAVFELRAYNSNYALYQRNAPEPIALLLKTNKPNKFVYRSLLNSGTVSYRKNSGLEISYFDSKTNQQKSVLLKSKN
ncbi:hypothetical protein [Christiangramia sp. OXR-203]|jgi:hypothetical protein|uniref:hypothetical protein n=1 Tax=Christiangramia sp. OXR-203 TaxID=3100176 RepID=UPI002AC915DD|nr:hypothetical protein [Christiangramia sp. OXR-203]WPY99117.1 hypothetical protein T8I65_02635 [Christiangramia sp. OXR-203]